MEHGSKALNISEWSNSTKNRLFSIEHVAVLCTFYYVLYQHHRQSAQIHQIHKTISPYNLLFSFCQLNSSTEKKRKHVVMVIIRLDHRRTTNTVVAWMRLFRIVRRSSLYPVCTGYANACNNHQHHHHHHCSSIAFRSTYHDDLNSFNELVN